MAQEFVFFGVDSDFTPDVMETVTRLGFAVAAGILTGDPEWDLRGLHVLVEEFEIDERLLSLPVAIPWFTPARRWERFRRAQEAGFTRFDPLIDPAAVIASTASVAEGVFVNVAASAGPYSVLGRSAVLNRKASVAHHAVVEEFASIGPGATVASRCRIGRGAMVGTGASVAPGLRIGAGSVIGLGAAVIRDVPDYTLVAGNPARVIRKLPDTVSRSSPGS